MSDIRTTVVLRSESFKGAEGLQAPLNDLLGQLQERLSAVEQRQEWVALGPQEVTLPIDVYTGNLPVDFSPPPGFTPGVAFVLQLKRRLHHAEVIADVKSAAGLKAGKDAHKAADMAARAGIVKPAVCVRPAVRAWGQR